LVKPQNYSTWKGTAKGLSLSAEFYRKKSKIPIVIDSSFVKEEFKLPEENFYPDSFIYIWNLKNYLGLKFFVFKERIYIAPGLEFVTQLHGRFGNKNFEKTIQPEYLGTDIYIVFKTGYNYSLTRTVSIVTEICTTFDLTINKSSVLNIGPVIGIGVKFDI
jgi:hypothetical protein